MGTWDLDLVHNVRSWSSEAEALFGLAPGAFAGDLAKFRRAIHPEDWQSLDAEWIAVLAEHRDFKASYRTVWPDGSVRWIEDIGRAFCDADGRLVRVTGTSMDITARKLAEEALRASEERFRRQYKGFPLPTYSWLYVGGDFVLEDFNDAAAVVTGFGNWIEESADSTVQDVKHAVRSFASNSPGGWPGVRASERFRGQPEIVADLHTCLTEQRVIRRELHYRYPVSGGERDLALTYVFVPPLTVMVHCEDITSAKQAHHQSGQLVNADRLHALGSTDSPSPQDHPSRP